MMLASQRILKQLVRKTSLSRVIAYLNTPDFEIKEIHEHQETILNWSGQIFITSDSLHITFKIQCDIESVQFFAQRLQLNRENSVVSSSLACDLLYEYCNMVGGYIKNTLDQQKKMSFKLGLPAITSNAQKLELISPSDENVFFDRWKIVSDGGLLFCSLVIEAKDDILLTGEILEFTDTGDIKFL